ncbi:MAG: PRC-barrel domain-containing protein [Alsobacter sp.]
MLMKHIAAGLVASTLLAAPALAQTNATAPATAGQAVSGPNGVQFYTQTTGTVDWRASKFVGVDIYGSNNEKIGDVNDLILDHEGTIQAVVIGVGGFLGIGEKNVAVPFKTVEWMTQPARSAGAANTAPASNNNANAANNAAGMNTANGTAATSSAAPANNTAAMNTNGPAMGNDVTGSTRANANLGYPDHGVLRMTKDQLKNAPTYRYPDDRSATAQ